MLRRLYGKEGAEADEHSINIVVVPGIGTASPEDWKNGSGSWLLTLLETKAPQARAWVYDYNVSAPDKTVLQQLLAEGHNLLDRLSEITKQDEQTPHPLLFICHSLGGVVVKKTLCIVCEHFFQHRTIIDVISGIFFLGVPHVTSDDKQRSNVVELILRCQLRPPPKNSVSREDNLLLANLSGDFEAVALQVPVLSAYEGKESPIHQGVFAKFRKPRQMIIITKPLSTTKARNEQVCEVVAGHHDICRVQMQSAFYERASHIIGGVADDAPRLVAEKFRKYITPVGLEADTLRSRTTLRDLALSERPDRSARPLAASSIQLMVPMVTTNEATANSTAMSFETVPLQASFEPEKKKDPRLPCYSVKPYEKRNDFFGREDVLKLIDDNLISSAHAPLEEELSQLHSFALCGMGGVGKTSVAVEYVFTRRWYFEAIFWLHADDVNILAEEFANIAQELGLESSKEGQDLTASRERVKGWLSNPVKSFNVSDATDNEVPWLLVFDNVDNFDVLQDYWPVTGQGSVLITSRDPLAKTSFYTANKGIDLQPFSTEESAKFMQTLTRTTVQTGQDELLTTIANKLGGLPYSIKQMAGVISQSRLTYSEFIGLVEKGELDKLHTGQSITTTLALDTLEPPTSALLQVMSLLDPDGISERILTEGCGKVSVGQYPKNLNYYYKARAALLKSSLIIQNVKDEQVWFHRIVQDQVRSKMDTVTLAQAFQAAVTLVSEVWPFQDLRHRHDRTRWEVCKEIFPHVTRLNNQCLELSSTSSEFRPDDSVAALFNDAGWYLFERGGVEESKPFYVMAQSICEKSPNRLSEDVAKILRESHNNQGSAAAETNDQEGSLKHSMIWLDLSESLQRTGLTTQKQNYEHGIVYNETGVAYGFNNMYDKAAECLIKCIKIFQALEEYEDTMLGWPAPNLGFIYWVQGRLQEAEQVLLEILDIHATAFGKDDTLSFKTGKILYALGNVYASQGRFHESLDFHNRCLTQYRITLGDGHHRTADICHRLADHSIRLGMYGEAQTYLDQALKIFSARPYYKRELARTTFKHAQLLQARGKSSEGSDAFSKAFELRCSVFPKDTRSFQELKEADFDNLVIFWSR